MQAAQISRLCKISRFLTGKDIVISSGASAIIMICKLLCVMRHPINEQPHNISPGELNKKRVSRQGSGGWEAEAC
jgi:hypothetical protein